MWSGTENLPTVVDHMYTPIRDFYLVSPQNRKSSANTNTIKMDEEDAERDRLLSVMFYMVSNGLKASKAAVKAAVEDTL